MISQILINILIDKIFHSLFKKHIERIIILGFAIIQVLDNLLVEDNDFISF